MSPHHALGHMCMWVGCSGLWHAHLLAKQCQAHQGLKKVANPSGFAAVMREPSSACDEPRPVAQGCACTSSGTAGNNQGQAGLYI